MLNYSMIDRAIFYNLAFPKYPPLCSTDRWLYGIWALGNMYGSQRHFFGEYPHGYLKRIVSLFPDAENILHLFSGSLDETTKGITFDINPLLKPDVVGDAVHLADYFPLNSFDLIFADPPYNRRAAEKYGYPYPNKRRVLQECYKILKPGGFLVWLDTMSPIYKKSELKLVGTIGVLVSTLHVVRMVFIWEKN